MSAKSQCAQVLRLCKTFPILIHPISGGLSSEETESILAIAGSCVFGVLLLVVVAFLVMKRLMGNPSPRASSVEDTDENPVYGMYYFADGQHIDYGTLEVQDENPYYDS